MEGGHTCSPNSSRFDPRAEASRFQPQLRLFLPRVTTEFVDVNFTRRADCRWDGGPRGVMSPRSVEAFK